jgi:hypothetical protein
MDLPADEICPFPVGSLVQMKKSRNRPNLPVTGRVVEIVSERWIKVLWSDSRMIVSARVHKLRRAL